MNITKSEPLFVAKGFPEQKYQLYRLDKSGKRMYYRFDAGRPIFYSGVTSFIKMVMPTSPHLIKWIADRGYDDSQDEMMESASYGTLLHIECQNLIIAGKCDLDSLVDRMKQYCKENSLDIKFVSEWHDKLQSDILAFSQFLIDYKVEPLAIEMMLCSDKMGIAGAIDLVCNMTISEKGFFGEVYKSGENKGKPKESKKEKVVKAVVDIKSGRKGFWESHEIQLHCYKRIVEENYPTHTIDRVFNFSPKDWRSAPSYNLKDQTEARSARKINALLEVFKTEFEGRDKYLMLFSGTIDINKGLERNIREVSIENYVTELQNNLEDSK